MKTTSSIFIPMKSNRRIRWIVILAAAAGVGHTALGAEAANAAPGITVASYYFGQYHPNDPRNEKVKGKGWSEWELIKAAKPRFPGHQQPKVPLWGYTDESDPQVMAHKIAAAADHGIHAFIFDAQSRQPILSHSPCTIHETQPPSHPVAGRRGAHG